MKTKQTIAIMKTKQELVVWKQKHNLKLVVAEEVVVLVLQQVDQVVHQSVVLQRVAVIADLQAVAVDKPYLRIF
jgi:hypothetical protein